MSVYYKIIANTNDNKKENDDKLFRHDVSQMPKKPLLRIKGGRSRGKGKGKGKGRCRSLRKSKKNHKRTKQKCKKKCKLTYKKSK